MIPNPISLRGGTRAVAGLCVSLFIVACAGTPPMPPPRFPTPFKVIAHRGASAYAPENTIPAYTQAQVLGVVDVELDVQLSKDDVVVLYHDNTLLKKTGQPGRVRDHTASELLKMDIGTWFDRTHPEIEEKFSGTPLNTLETFFETFGNSFQYHIELKSDDEELVRLTLKHVSAHDLEDNARLTSFLFDQVMRARQQAPQIPTDLLVRDAARLRKEAGVAADAVLLPLQKAWVDRAADAGFALVGFPAEDMTPELVQYAVSRGLEIRAWRIRGDEDMHHALEVGAYGMTTNWPDRLIRELLRQKRAGGS
jgi:glycerophosphoryl diester phosphodiesterase